MTAASRRRVGPLAAVALTLLVVVIAAVALQPWWLTPLVTRTLTASSGREVHFDSIRVGLSSRFEPVVSMRGVRIANAPWADRQRPFARLAEAVAHVSWRSLAERRPVVGLLILRDGEVDFEIQADGLRNWRLSDPDNRGPGRYKVLALQAERATVRVKHGGIDLDLLATASANVAGAVASGSGVALPTRIDLKGSWRALDFAASVATGPVLTLLDTGETFPLHGSVDAGGARLEADGRAGDIFRAPTFSAEIVAAGDTLAPFHAFIGSSHEGLGRTPFRFTGRLDAHDRSYSLALASGRVGTTDLAGTIGVSSPHERGMVNAKLHSESADSTDLRWLTGRAWLPAQRAIRNAATASAAPASGATFASARIRDVELALDIRHLRAAELPWLRSLKLEAALLDGRMTVAALDAGVLNGQASGHGSFDMRTDPAQAQGELTLHGMRLESLLGSQPEKKKVSGLLRARVRLQATGNSADALLASATGSADADLTDGALSGLLDAEIGLQGGNIVRRWLGGPESVAIRCAVAAVDLSGGKGRIRTLVLDTERTRTVGTGTVDLRRETFDVVLTPSSKRGGLLVLDRSIHLHGPFDKPARELVERAAVASAGQPCAPEAARSR